MNIDKILDVAEGQRQAIIAQQYRRWWRRRHWPIVAAAGAYLGWLVWIWGSWILRVGSVSSFIARIG